MHKTPKGTLIYDSGECIIKEGELSKTIFFLISGKVGVYKGGDLIGVIDKPNSPIGEISAILGVKRTATCIALERSELVAYKGGIDEIVEKYPKTAKAIIINLAERVARTTERITRKEENKTESSSDEIRAGAGKKEEKQKSEDSVFGQILELPQDKIGKFLSLISEKELAVIIANLSESSRDKLSKFIPSRKMQAIEDLVIFYSKNGLSSAEMAVLREKISDMIAAFYEEGE